jgi:hypothetical protein
MKNNPEFACLYINALCVFVAVEMGRLLFCLMDNRNNS